MFGSVAGAVQTFWGRLVVRLLCLLAVTASFAIHVCPEEYTEGRTQRWRDELTLPWGS